LYAIFHGLRIAYDAGHMNIILESDSRMTLDLIMSDVQSHHPHAFLISQIVQLQHRDWIVNFHYILRQGNKCADWLAKQSASSSDALKSWIFCPPQLHHSLLDDASRHTRGIPGSIPKGNNVWSVRMPRRTSRINCPSLMDRKSIRKKK